MFCSFLIEKYRTKLLGNILISVFSNSKVIRSVNVCFNYHQIFRNTQDQLFESADTFTLGKPCHFTPDEHLILTA